MLFHDSIASDTTDGMFDPDAQTGNSAIALFLFGSEFFATRLFQGLDHGHVCQGIALQTSILSQASPYADASFHIHELSEQNFPRLFLSHLNKYGTISLRSGLNWGKRFEHKRKENEAYIPVPIVIANSGFFPTGGRYFTVLTDDQKVITARLEQQNNKALTSPLNNSILGEYFRDRLQVPAGAEVKTLYLEQYGRTDVEFTKLDSETYYMDFSV